MNSVSGSVVIGPCAALPYCECCDFQDQLTDAPLSFDVGGNLDDSCWTGSELSCP